MKTNLSLISILCEVVYSKLLRLFKIKRDESVIPEGSYCYVWDEEKNKAQPIDGYWIKSCKYYRNISENNRACLYTGFVGFDFCLYDQCKICGVKEHSDNETDL